MYSCKAHRAFPVLAIALIISGPVLAEGYVLGFGAEGDSADGRALSGFADLGLGKRTWLSLSGTLAETEGIIADNETARLHTSLDYFLEPVGFRLGGGYWGNADILDSRDLTGSIYVRGNGASLSLDYEKRYFEFDLQSDLLRGRTVEFDADGWGLGARLPLGENASFFASGMVYEYSRNLRIQADIAVLAFISNSRLSMVNNLIDDRFSAGLEFEFGLRSIDVTAGRWQTAVDGSQIDSYSVGFLTPVSDRLDMEIRLSFDDSETFGETTAVSFYLYYFGGT